MTRVGVIGAGSWGTALANLLAENGHDVELWAYEREVQEQINTSGENRTFLPGAPLHGSLEASCDLRRVAEDKDLVLVVVPSHVFRTVMEQAAEHIESPSAIVSATKGIENRSLCFMSDVLGDVLPERFHSRLAYLSGPSFAKEVVRNCPTAVTVASHNARVAGHVQDVFSNDVFRVYTSKDVVGIEVAGAMKNVIAIAAGVCEGLELGSNSMAALITRGVAEITRFGLALGANPLTFSGLSGIGDLVLTCSGGLSRNRSVGFELGKGRNLAEILDDMVMVAEGVRTCQSVHDLAEKKNVDMPICEQVYKILYENASPGEAVNQLMTRELKPELAGMGGHG